MGKKLYPHNRLKYWWCYSIKEICDVYKDTGLHAQTIRKWTRDGLQAIDKKKPALYFGHDLIDFLKASNDRNKCQTSFNEMYCFSCKDKRRVFQNRVAFQQKANALRAKSVCKTCKSKMNKIYKLSDFQKLKRSFHVVDVSQLYDCESSTLKTHIDDSKKMSEFESRQGNLFS